MDIKAIRELFKKLKKDRIVLTYEEFSERLGYNRTYISRVLNNHEPLTPDIIKKIKETDFSVTNNVPRETINESDELSGYTQKELIALLKKEREESKNRQLIILQLLDVLKSMDKLIIQKKS